jgi:hypothetical protein
VVYIPGGPFDIRVSGNGEVIMIRRLSGSGDIWSESSGRKGLPTDLIPEAISFDGTVVAGRKNSNVVGDRPAFRWSMATGTEWLFDGGAQGISTDGQVVFGGSIDAEIAAIWDAGHGSRPIQPILANELGLANDLEGIHLRVVRVMSGNRQTVIGGYTDSDEVVGAWVTLLDQPLVPFASNALCGDLDSDRDVDSADLLNFLENWTGSLEPSAGSATLAMGDCDGDKDVDSADMLQVLESWTGAEPNALAGLAVVPEPGSATGLWALVLLGVHRSRRIQGNR